MYRARRENRRDREEDRCREHNARTAPAAIPTHRSSLADVRLARASGSLRLGPRRARLVDVSEGVAQLLDPVALVLTHELHAPCERLAAAAGDVGLDERVEHAPLLHPQPRHDRDAERREHHALAAALDAPRHLAAELVLGSGGDANALLAGLLSEGLDPGQPGGGPSLGVLPGALGVGEGPDDENLVAAAGDLGGS